MARIDPIRGGRFAPSSSPAAQKFSTEAGAVIGSDCRSSMAFRFAPCARKNKGFHSRRVSLSPVAGDAVRRVRLARRDGVVFPVAVRDAVVARRRALIVPGRHRRGLAPAAFVFFHLAFLLIRPAQRRPGSARRSRLRRCRRRSPVLRS